MANSSADDTVRQGFNFCSILQWLSTSEFQLSNPKSEVYMHGLAFSLLWWVYVLKGSFTHTTRRYWTSSEYWQCFFAKVRQSHKATEYQQYIKLE